MNFLKCNNCGHLNELKTQYLTFCSNCNKILENNFSKWQKNNPEKSFDEFIQLMCVPQGSGTKSNQQVKSGKSGRIKFWIGFSAAFAIFSVAAFYGGHKLFSVLKKPLMNQAIVVLSKEINKSCPVMIDNVTRLDSTVALPIAKFQYNHTILLSKDSINIEEFKNFLTPHIISSVKTTPQLKLFRDNQITLNYNYKDIKGNDLFSISVEPEQYE